ncbi:MAG: peptide chain release factor N(5)-glutamine methyltransferase [Candidatus Delongbacteria bacterium]
MNPAPPDLAALLRLSRDWLAARGVENAAREADELAARALGCRRLDLYLDHDRVPDEAEKAGLRGLLQRRVAGEPLQYILGDQPFRRAGLRVDSRVLIPRPETEELVDHVLAGERGQGPLSVLDAGTGSGCLAISLAQELPGCRVLAVDTSSGALEVARENARLNGVAERIEFQRLNLLLHWPQEARDLLVSNPPYVALSERAGLQRELSHEPEEALFGGEDGLIFYRRFAGGLEHLLRPGGRLYLEIGAQQAPALLELFAPLCSRLEIRPDLAGRPRFLVGRRSE